jgi:NAD(P)-dependent dehydrogenase (short-subunit alcohol dehydrogenase family)
MSANARVWLVTGASSGFGRAIAEAAVAAGDTVIGTARRTESMDGLVAAHSDQVEAISLDITDSERVDAVAADVLARHGRVDVLVNSAGRTQVGAFEETTDRELRDLSELHVFGPARLTRAPRRLVPDNCVPGVDRPDLYDPKINRSYAELAEHYGVLVDPARRGKPRDKARVERPMPYIRDSFWRGRQFASVEAMQAAAVARCREVAGRRSSRRRWRRSRPSIGGVCWCAVTRPLPVTRCWTGWSNKTGDAGGTWSTRSASRSAPLSPASRHRGGRQRSTPTAVCGMVRRSPS